jgi:hypothetical protein
MQELEETRDNEYPSAVAVSISRQRKKKIYKYRPSHWYLGLGNWDLGRGTWDISPASHASHVMRDPFTR